MPGDLQYHTKKIQVPWSHQGQCIEIVHGNCNKNSRKTTGQCNTVYSSGVYRCSRKNSSLCSGLTTPWVRFKPRWEWQGMVGNEQTKRFGMLLYTKLMKWAWRIEEWSQGDSAQNKHTTFPSGNRIIGDTPNSDILLPLHVTSLWSGQVATLHFAAFFKDIGASIQYMYRQILHSWMPRVRLAIGLPEITNLKGLKHGRTCATRNGTSVLCPGSPTAC